MALTIETGAGVALADSYSSIIDFTNYAANYGFAIPATDAAKEALLRRASLQMNSLHLKY